MLTPSSLAPILAPSILSANFARLGDDVRAVLAAGADWVHFDVMDNHYVPNLSFGPMVCGALRQDGVTAPIDVHLMVRPVDALITEFVQAGASRICFHPEASDHPDRSLRLIKNAGLEAGLALNPGTPISALGSLLDPLDFVLVMSVNPGFGGQQFLPHVTKKIAALREWFDREQHPSRIQVDGGIKVDNIRAVAEAGADSFVSGSAIFGSASYSQTIDHMRGEAQAGIQART